MFSYADRNSTGRFDTLEHGREIQFVLRHRVENWRFRCPEHLNSAGIVGTLQAASPVGNAYMPLATSIRTECDRTETHTFGRKPRTANTVVWTVCAGQHSSGNSFGSTSQANTSGGADRPEDLPVCI